MKSIEHKLVFSGGTGQRLPLVNPMSSIQFSMLNCIQPCSNVNFNKTFLACFVYTPLLIKKKKEKIHPEIRVRSPRHNSSQSFSFSAAAAFQYKPLQQVNADVLECLLLHHPNRAEVQYVVDGFRHGFDLGLM